jgi:hypothetical protein
MKVLLAGILSPEDLMLATSYILRFYRKLAGGTLIRAPAGHTSVLLFIDLELRLIAQRGYNAPIR